MNTIVKILGRFAASASYVSSYLTLAIYVIDLSPKATTIHQISLATSNAVANFSALWRELVAVPPRELVFVCSLATCTEISHVNSHTSAKAPNLNANRMSVFKLKAD
uniref:Uncharacterized protein n=1 Tax=Glossina pallidipes TaxID=7398 RepID=A0A1B0ABI1_GLOPL